MRRLALSALALAVALPHAYGGTLPLLGVGKQPTAAAAYTGPGDIVSGALAWYGLRGYNGAFSGNVANVCDAATGLVCADATWSGGTLSLPLIGGIACNDITNICQIATLYDQSGAGLDAVQATSSKRPTLLMACLGSLPCMNLTRASAMTLKSAGTIATAEPYTFSSVSYLNGATSGSHNIIVVNGGGFRYNATTPTIDLIDGGSITSSITTTTWYAAQGVINAASSYIFVNSAATTGSLTGDLTGNVVAIGCNDASGNCLDGRITEVGLWPSAFSSGNRTAMESNQRAYWGF